MRKILILISLVLFSALSFGQGAMMGSVGASGGISSIIDDGNDEGWYIAESEYITTDGQDSVEAWSCLLGIGPDFVDYDTEPSSKPIFKGDSILFNGTSSNLLAALTISQPITIYLVVNQIGWADEDRFYDGGAYLKQNGSTPRISVYAGSTTTTEDGPPIGQRALIVLQLNDTDSYLEVNGVEMWTGVDDKAAGSNGFSNLYLGSVNRITGFANISVAELLIRSVNESSEDRLTITTDINDRHNLY